MLLQPLDQVEADVTSIPAPVRGWNRRDPLANMKPGFAVVLDNWFPLPEAVMLRRGSVDWATDITDEGESPVDLTVNTLITYRPQTGNQELWAFAGDRLYNVSSSGPVGASVVSGLSNDEWNCTNFSVAGENYLLCLNGLDNMLAYNGTDWEAIDDASVMFAIDGVDTSLLINLFVHKERPYYIEKGSMNAWYPDRGAVGGTLTQLDLSSVFKKGGFLLAGGSWSVDAGDGPDDYAAFVTSEGEIAIYKGDDPGDPELWALVGVFEIGPPIGRRCLMKYGGDLLILTTDGIVSATASFQRGREQARQLALTDVIRGAVAEASGSFRSQYGWHMLLYAEASMLLVNVPETGGVKQWAMNTVTKAWGRFRGWETTCFEVFNGELYFGAKGAVRKAWTGKNDNGTKIVGDLVPAFDYYGTRARTKQWTMLRPVVEWDANPLAIKIGFDADFDIKEPSQQIAFTAGSVGGLWDQGLWNQARWGGSLAPAADWYSVEALGLAGAPHLIVESNVSSAKLMSFDVVYMKGSIFG